LGTRTSRSRSWKRRASSTDRETLPPQLETAVVKRAVALALSEDLGWGDLTTESLVPPSQKGRGTFLVKGQGVLCGLGVAEEVFRQVDASLRFEPLRSEGSPVEKGDLVATVQGSLASILKAERTALNFLQRLSGVASETAAYVAAVAGLATRIIDTRKTTPGLRALEKYAVRVGGGHNHRTHLGDGVLVKDNHLAALANRGLGLREAVVLAKARAPHTIRVEVEVTSLAQAQEAVAAGAEMLLLDNMSPEAMRAAVDWTRSLPGPRPLLEASGGVRLETVRAVAETGVDLISVGALTHSARALDISLEVEGVGGIDC
jgi:nicotinate-nucleotide pyrophosphorylase (carboxylating)